MNWKKLHDANGEEVRVNVALATRLTGFTSGGKKFTRIYFSDRTDQITVKEGFDQILGSG
jgi:hypothetical protein